MSYASDALLKDTVSKVSQLEKMVDALNVKLDALNVKVQALENIAIPRPILHARENPSVPSVKTKGAF